MVYFGDNKKISFQNCRSLCSFKMKFFIASLLIYPVLSSSKICPKNYIRRISDDLNEYCCRKVENNCTAGTFVQKCSNDLEKDICKPCPDDTWIVDETNSDLPFQCEEYSCHYGAKRVNYLSTSGCSLPCVCDTTNNFYGLDSCNCNVFSGNCKPGTTLSINGSCLSDRIAEEIYKVKSDETVFILKPEITDNHVENQKTSINENVPIVDISRTTSTVIDSTKISSFENKTKTDTKGIVDNNTISKILITALVCSAILCLFLLAFFGVGKFRRKKGVIRESSSSQESHNSQDDEDITDVKITECTYVKSTDSGISLLTTSSQDPTEKRVQDKSPLGAITPFRDKQVALVFPTPHDPAEHNQTTVPLLATYSNEPPLMALSTSSRDYIIQQSPEL